MRKSEWKRRQSKSDCQMSLTVDKGTKSLRLEEWRGGEAGERGGGLMGALVGEVSGEASVEKGDSRRRMERSSEGLEEQGGGRKARPSPRREKRGGLGEERW